MTRALRVFYPILAAASLACAGAHAAQRAFVASTGSDANMCTLAAPCRSFSAALAVVDAGGEIVALDAAGYGSVAITKSVTIASNPGFYAGIAGASGDAVLIATPGIEVVLRGLHINGTGGVNGIQVMSVSTLAVENCVISNFAATGINVFATAKARISDSVMRGNGTGVSAAVGAMVDVSRSKLTGNFVGASVIADVTGTSSRLSVSESIAAGNFYGLRASSEASNGASATLSISRSTITGGGHGVWAQSTGTNAVSVTIGASHVTHNEVTGLVNQGGATFETMGDNQVRYNNTNTSGSFTTIGGF